MKGTAMRSKDLRKLIFLALSAAFCFGGTFVCTTSSDDDHVHPHAMVTPVLP